MSNDKIINLENRIPWDQKLKNTARILDAELNEATRNTSEAESTLKAFYDYLGDDSVLAQHEAELGVTGIMNVIYAAFPDRPRETLDDMLKDD